MLIKEYISFKRSRSCVEQIIKLKQLGEKDQEKKRRVHVSFMDLEKIYDGLAGIEMYAVAGKLSMNI